MLEVTHALLLPEDEQRLAQEIESRDVDVWAALLGHPGTAAYVLGCVEESVGDAPREAAPLRVAAGKACRCPSEEAQLALEREARRLAPRLRSLDLDREARRLVVARLRALARRPRSGRLGFSTWETGYQEYLQQVDVAERASEIPRAELACHNLRLVAAIARRYRKKGLSQADLIQEGCIGLLIAVDRFDHRRKTRFSTFATWWIRHTVCRAIEETSRLVRVPVHVQAAKRRITKVRRRLAAQFDRTPAREEVAGLLGMAPSQIAEVDQKIAAVALPLDADHGAGPGSWHDVFALETDERERAVERAEARAVFHRVETAISELSPRDADVVRRHYGLGGQRALSLAEIANDYGLSRERVRQLNEAALASLRAQLRGQAEARRGS